MMWIEWVMLSVILFAAVLMADEAITKIERWFR